MTIEGDADIRRREAAEWFARLNQRTVTTADVKGFSEWRRDPANAQAFGRVEALWDAAGTLAKDPEMKALTREASGVRPPQNGVRRPAVSCQSAPLAPWRWALASRASFGFPGNRRATPRR